MRWTRQSQAQRLDPERDRGLPPDERAPRTAKSCGPGAATLALRWQVFLLTTGARKAASPGRARISRKTIARGKPGCLGCTCQIRVHSFSASAHGDAGAVGAWLSLRPLRSERDNEIARLGQILPRDRGFMSITRRRVPDNAYLIHQECESAIWNCHCALRTFGRNFHRRSGS
jgi:hypothetical protein